MKKITSAKTIILLIFMAISSSVVITSCKDDPCDDVTCLNGGTCFDGNCDCPFGYEGVTCGTEMRAKFITTYNCTNQCFPGVSYTQTISTSASSVLKFVINDLGDVNGLNVVAELSGTNDFDIDSQNVVDSDGDSWTISGSGTLSGNTISVNITYTFLPTSDTFTCTESWVKQ